MNWEEGGRTSSPSSAAWPRENLLRSLSDSPAALDAAAAAVAAALAASAAAVLRRTKRRQDRR
jgi:hypothetical protein